MISVALDIRRLVDAHVQRQPYQGITRYTLRLFEELAARSDLVDLNPVYLHPLDPARVGLERALEHTAALDTLRMSIGGGAETPRISNVSRALLRLLTRAQQRLAPDDRLGRVVRRLQYVLLARDCRAIWQPGPMTDVFHSPVNPLPAPADCPSRRRVLTVHDCIYLKRPDLYPLPGRTPAIRLALDSIATDVDYVICDSQSTRRDLLELSPVPAERVRVVPLAADNRFSRPDRTAGACRLAEIGVSPDGYLLALAQSEKRKNIARLIAAHRRAASGLDLVLVCSPAHAPGLRREIGGNPDPAVHILTGVDDAALSGLLSLATAFVYVPLYEGFGIPILEAMAAGCPVLTASNSSIPEVAGDAALYVDAEDEGSIAAGIDRLVGDSQLRDALRLRGERRAAQFSWQRTADETIAVYQEAVEGGSASCQGAGVWGEAGRRSTTRAGAASRPSSAIGRHSSS